jgi:hypothetical protein
MRAEAAEKTLIEMASQNDEVRVDILSDLTNYLGGFSGDNMDLRGCGRTLNVLLKFHFQAVRDFRTPSGIHVLGGAGAIVGTGVDDVEFSPEGLGNAIAFGDEFARASVEIDGDDDAFDVFRFVRGNFDVSSGKDGYVRVTQHSSGNGAEQETAEGTEPVGGKHDEAGVFLIGDADDLTGGISFAYDPIHFAALQIDVDEILQLRFKERLPLRIPIRDGGSGYVEPFDG